MVYFGGKPSTGCQSCRRRKIKCDQKSGGCTNCEKRDHECSGYRNETDLKFRDESEHVARKSKEREASRRKVSRSPLPEASSASAESSRRPSAASKSRRSSRNSLLSVAECNTGIEHIMSQHDEFFLDTSFPGLLSPDLDDQALAFFFSNHVLGEWHTSFETNIHSHGMDDALFLAVKATGLAGISGFAHTPGLTVEARKRYLAAIQSVNNEIVFPENAKKDSTLTSIMLLSQIEAIECFTPGRSLSGWENHVKGAAAVLKLRGAEQLKTPLEVRLFVQAVSGLVVCCMKNGIHLPNHLFELAAIAGQYTNTDSPGWRNFHAHMLVTQFAAEVKHKLIKNPHDIIQRALDLDGLVSLIFLDAEPQWTFDTIYDDTHPEIILHGHYYMYQNFMSAQVWNGMRAMRVLLHGTIRKTLLKGFAEQPPIFSSLEYTAQFQASTDLLYQMQDELMASIPQYFLFRPKTKSPPFKFPWSNFNSDIYNLSRTGENVSENIPLIRSIGGYLLPWLLYRTGNISITKRDTLDYILGLLRLVGSEMGMQMAFILAKDLKEKVLATVRDQNF